MPLGGCNNGVFATVLLAVLLLPVRYFVPELGAGEPPAAVAPPVPAYTFEWPQFSSVSLLDTVIVCGFTFSLLVISTCDWIQRKNTERRLFKLNQHLKESFAQLYDFNARQEQVERSVHAVKKATAEYSLLLYLLLRRCRLTPHEPPPAASLLDKHLDEYELAGGSAAEL